MKHQTVFVFIWILFIDCLSTKTLCAFQFHIRLRLLNNNILEYSLKSKTVMKMLKTTNVYLPSSRMWINLLSSFKLIEIPEISPYENIYSYRKSAQTMQNLRAIHEEWTNSILLTIHQTQGPTSNDHNSNWQRKPWEGWRTQLARDVDENWKINMPIRHNKYRTSQQTDFVYQSSTTSE